MINTASASLHGKQADSREVAAKYGYYHGGGIGTGGFANLDLMLNVARTMEEICPDAWLIQSGNPVYEGCTLMTHETSIKVCGLCHGHYGVYGIRRVLGMKDEDITWQAPGLNREAQHLAYPLLLQGRRRLSPAGRLDRKRG